VAGFRGDCSGLEAYVAVAVSSRSDISAPPAEGSTPLMISRMVRVDTAVGASTVS